MRNPFVTLGIILIVGGVIGIFPALGVLGHNLIFQILYGMFSIVAIGCGTCLIQLMKDDSLYQETKESLT